jgi:hypothetical protein
MFSISALLVYDFWTDHVRCDIRNYLKCHSGTTLRRHLYVFVFMRVARGIADVTPRGCMPTRAKILKLQANTHLPLHNETRRMKIYTKF